MTDDGPACDAVEQGVSGWVIVGKVPAAPEVPAPPPVPPILEPGQQHIYRPAYSYRGDDGILHPTYDEFAYRAVKEHVLPTKVGCDLSTNFFLLNVLGVPVEQLPAFSDYIACQLVRTGELPAGETVHVGDWFYYKMNFSGGGGSSFPESFGSLVETGGSALGVGVDFIANAYNDAVTAVKNLGYDVLLSLGGPVCEQYPDECKKGIEIGMTYAMTSAGLPPSLPNWDELKQEGLEYFAHVVAERMEEEGIPAPITEQALRLLIQAIVDQMTEHRGSTTNLALSWMQRWYGFAPSSWSVVIKKNTPDPLPTGMTFQTKRTALFEGSIVPVPKTFPPPIRNLPYSLVRLPIVLPPNFEGIPPPHCIHTPRTFPFRTCVPLPPFFKSPICQYEQWVGEWVTYTDNGCQLLGDMVQVYYRDAWLQGRFETTPCTAIAGVTLHVVGILNFVFPGYTFFMGAAVPPTVGLMWDDGVFDGCSGP